MEPHKIPFLYNFSPSIVPPPLDWPEWIRITGRSAQKRQRSKAKGFLGYWFLDAADVSSKKWEPPQDLLDFIDEARKAQKKIVYIGFGSIVVPDPKTMTRCVIDAIVQSGVYAILSKGWSDRLVRNAPAQTEPEEPLPKQIYPISSVPHDWLFKQIDAACHHGGAVTTGASLRGMPSLIATANTLFTLNHDQPAFLRSSSPSSATSSSGATELKLWASVHLCAS